MTAGRSPSARSETTSVPPAVVERLGLYLRELQHVQASGAETTSSSQLGERLGFTDAQVRKDLAHFGQFGQPGVGYRCSDLITRIRQILGTDRQWQVALVGVGNLGRALLGYKGFESQGFVIAAAFDADAAKAGTTVEGVAVYSIGRVEELVRSLGIELGVIAVPAEFAQHVADRLVAAGVSGILNFAPVTLSVPEGVSQIGVDLARQLEQVAFAVGCKGKSQGNGGPERL
jgi:redox-sensing transcriptional repressor